MWLKRYEEVRWRINCRVNPFASAASVIVYGGERHCFNAKTSFFSGFSFSDRKGLQNGIVAISSADPNRNNFAGSYVPIRQLYGLLFLIVFTAANRPCLQLNA